MNPEDSQPKQEGIDRRGLLKAAVSGGVSTAVASGGGLGGSELLSSAEELASLKLAEKHLGHVTNTIAHIRFIKGFHIPDTSNLDTSNLVITGENDVAMTLPIPEDMPEQSNISKGNEPESQRSLRSIHETYRQAKAVLLTDGAQFNFDSYEEAALNSTDYKTLWLINKMAQMSSGTITASATHITSKDYPNISRRTFLGIALGSVVGAAVGRLADKPVKHAFDRTDTSGFTNTEAALWEAVLPMRDFQTEMRNHGMVLNTYALNPTLQNLKASDLLFHAGNGHNQVIYNLQEDIESTETRYKSMLSSNINNILTTTEDLLERSEDKQILVDEAGTFLGASIIYSAGIPAILTNKGRLSLKDVQSTPVDLSVSHSKSGFIIAMEILDEIQNREDLTELSMLTCKKALNTIKSFYDFVSLEYRDEPELGWEVGLPLSPHVGEQDEMDVFGTRIRHLDGIITKIE